LLLLFLIVDFLHPLGDRLEVYYVWYLAPFYRRVREKARNAKVCVIPATERFNIV
jgi:hypothetical protein